jgi:hypothetical protein
MKRVPKSFQFKTCAKQLEQGAHQYHATYGHQEDVGVSTHLWQVPENYD